MSTNAKRTAGPLFVKASAAPMAHNGGVAVINSKGTLIAVAYHRADGSAADMARLIAAAPTMYQYIEAKASIGDAEAQKILEAINASR